MLTVVVIPHQQDGEALVQQFQVYLKQKQAMGSVIPDMWLSTTEMAESWKRKEQNGVSPMTEVQIARQSLRFAASPDKNIVFELLL